MVNHNVYCPKVECNCFKGIPAKSDLDCVLWVEEGSGGLCLMREKMLMQLNKAIGLLEDDDEEVIR